MNKQLSTGLILAIVFQLLVLTSMYVKAAIPLWTGQEIKVKTIPVDPRSLFRGNYARLRYDFDRVDGKYLGVDENLRSGDVVYVSLNEQSDGLYVFSGAGLQEPVEKVFLRGRVIRHHMEKIDKENYKRSYDVNYGIDAFFAPKEKALALEKELRDGGVAVLMVGDDGRARIKDVIGQ